MGNKSQEQMMIEQLVRDIYDSSKALISGAINQADFVLSQIQKNNSVSLYALNVREPVEVGKPSISPTIYLDGYAKDVMDGRITLNEAAERVKEAYMMHRQDVVQLPELTYESAEQNLFAVAINYDANRDLLTDVPFVKVEDLAIIPRFRCSDDSSFLVKHHICTSFGMTGEEVIEQAIKNTSEAEEYTVKSMHEVLRDMMPELEDETFEEMIAMEQGPQMYVVSNSNSTYGAVEPLVSKKCLLDLQDIFDGDFILIPSSIHEQLAVSAEGCDAEELKLMICDVNEHQLRPDEVLSDHPYLVDSSLKIKAIGMAETETPIIGESEKLVMSLKM